MPVAMAPVASADCRQCGEPISTRAKPGNTIRCPACGHAQRFRPAAQVARIHGTGAAGWDPPSGPRQPRPAAEPCPRCAGPVLVDPRSITRWCEDCNTLLTPPGVLAPYERGTEVTRAAPSQRERDDDAKKTALLAGEFLRRVRAMLDDPKIHPASADLLGWYEEEITEARKARDGRRLAELAAEFDDDHASRAFRRVHWWQGTPAAIETTVYHADDDEGQDYEDEDDTDEPEPDCAPAVLATPASIAAQQHRAQPGPMTWAGAVAACGWRLSPTIGGCQIVEHHELCGAETTNSITGGWVCARHYAALCSVITQAHHQRSA